MAQINQPDKPKAFCSKNGCIEKVHGNLSYCKEHAEEGKGPMYMVTSSREVNPTFTPPESYHYKQFVVSNGWAYILWERDE